MRYVHILLHHVEGRDTRILGVYASRPKAVKAWRKRNPEVQLGTEYSIVRRAVK